MTTIYTVTAFADNWNHDDGIEYLQPYIATIKTPMTMRCNLMINKDFDVIDLNQVFGHLGKYQQCKTVTSNWGSMMKHYEAGNLPQFKTRLVG